MMSAATKLYEKCMTLNRTCPAFFYFGLYNLVSPVVAKSQIKKTFYKFENYFHGDITILYKQMVSP